MGNGLKFGKVTDQGIYTWSDWSYYTQREVLKDINFWRIFSMLFLSVTFAYYMKLHFSIVGVQHHRNTAFLV